MALSTEESQRIIEEEELRFRTRRALAREFPSTASREWKPVVAFLLSLVIPGSGQMYKGYVGSGLAWLLLVTCGYIAFIVPGLALHACCLVSAAYGRSKDEVRAGKPMAVNLEWNWKTVARFGLAIVALIVISSFIHPK
jgi:hypothetical protein